MKTILIGAALTLAASGAFAQEITQFDDTFVSTKTRAEVATELAQAGDMAPVRAQGGEITWAPPVPDRSSRNPAVIRAEGRSAAQMHAENSLYAPRYQN